VIVLRKSFALMEHAQRVSVNACLQKSAKAPLFLSFVLTGYAPKTEKAAREGLCAGRGSLYVLTLLVKHDVECQAGYEQT